MAVWAVWPFMTRRRERISSLGEERGATLSHSLTVPTLPACAVLLVPVPQCSTRACHMYSMRAAASQPSVLFTTNPQVPIYLAASRLH